MAEKEGLTRKKNKRLFWSHAHILYLEWTVDYIV